MNVPNAEWPSQSEASRAGSGVRAIVGAGDEVEIASQAELEHGDRSLHYVVGVGVGVLEPPAPLAPSVKMTLGRSGPAGSVWYHSTVPCPLARRIPTPPGQLRGRPATLEPSQGRPTMLISVIALGILASLDPLRPVVFVLVLRTQLVNAIAFLAGWTLALSLLFVVVLVTFAGEISTGADHRHRTAASVVEIAVGATLLIVAASRWRRRHDEQRSWRIPAGDTPTARPPRRAPSGSHRRVDPAAGADRRGRRRRRP